MRVRRNEQRAASDIDDYVLRKEMSHRINNEYACAINAVCLRASKSPNAELRTALADVATLLMQFADIHRALTFPVAADPLRSGSYLQRLCRVLSNTRLKDRNIRLLLVESGPQLRSAENGWKLGLIVSELVTNSCRHAFGANGGDIRIDLEKSGATTKCFVRDNGRKQGNRPPGQGLKQMRSLVQSAGGTLDYHFGERGATALISIPNSEALRGIN